jgi:hypothetical protein
MGDLRRHKSALAALAILACVVVIGDGLLKSKRAERNTTTLRAAVAALSPQELAVAVAACEAPVRRGEPPRRDAAYCAEVSRRLDEQPLQIVETPAVGGKP